MTLHLMNRSIHQQSRATLKQTITFFLLAQTMSKNSCRNLRTIMTNLLQTRRWFPLFLSAKSHENTLHYRSQEMEEMNFSEDMPSTAIIICLASSDIILALSTKYFTRFSSDFLSASLKSLVRSLRSAVLRKNTSTHDF